VRLRPGLDPQVRLQPAGAAHIVVIHCPHRPQSLVAKRMGLNQQHRAAHLGKAIRMIGSDAANALFHVVTERHLRRRSMVFTTNKPVKSWGEVLHDEDLGEAIVSERGWRVPPSSSLSERR
jgi:IstB-like ATP binding protein